MLINLLKHIQYGSSFGAIEHQKSENGEKLALLLLKKKKNEFKIELQKQFNSFNEISTAFNKEQHLYLIINNNQVLSKTISKELDFNKVVPLAFPTIKLSDFYYEVIQSEATTIVSICRKEYVDNLLGSYKGEHINIIGFSLGNSSITTLLSIIDFSNFCTSNATVSTSEHQLISIDSKTASEEIFYNINGITLSNNYILALAGIIKYYTNQKTIASNFVEVNLSTSKTFSQKRFFNAGLKIGLGLLFFLLVVNFLLFNFYTDKISVLTEKAQINQSSTEKINMLSKELEIKKKLVDVIVHSANSKTSLYFDQIGVSVPTSILLNTLEYQPLLKNVEENKKIDLNQKVLIIKGTIANGDHFSGWIKDLENINWIQSVEIIAYGTGKKKVTAFELKVNLK